MNCVHVFGDCLILLGDETYSVIWRAYCMTIASADLPSLWVWSANVLSWSIAWRGIWITICCLFRPVVIEGAVSKRIIRRRYHGGWIHCMLCHASHVWKIGDALLLSMESSGQSIDLAFEFGNPTISFLLSFSCGRGCNAAKAVRRIHLQIS